LDQAEPFEVVRLKVISRELIANEDVSVRRCNRQRARNTPFRQLTSAYSITQTERNTVEQLYPVGIFILLAEVAPLAVGLSPPSFGAKLFGIGALHPIPTHSFF
jgi:hypothetical protein